jgi:hypothetical protein
MFNAILSRRVLIALSLLAAAGYSTVHAQAVPVCDALTMYGNAANSGLCQGLSPGTQNLKVCNLAATPDIHTTFNAGTPLHVTVRVNPGNPTCQGNAQLTGVWPGGLAILGGQPNAICGVGIQNWVNRLNAVNQVNPGPGQTFCRAAFIAAGNSGRLSPQEVTQYNNLCAQHHCP